MRTALSLIVALMMASCGSVEYRDTNSAVDANPLCVGNDDDKPVHTGSMACERKTETVIGGSRQDSKPIDFSGKKDDD